MNHTTTLESFSNSSTPSHQTLKTNSNQPPLPTTKSHTMQTHLQIDNMKLRHILDLAHNIHTINEPNNHKSIMQIPHWHQVMCDEFNAFLVQKTWTLVPSPPNQNILGSKWMFKTKVNSDDSIAYYKARLMAQGYKQQEVINYSKTFILVAKITIICLFIPLLHLMDEISINWMYKFLSCMTLSQNKFTCIICQVLRMISICYICVNFIILSMD